MTIETATTLDLTEEEAVLLRETLAEYLSDLRMQIAGTDSADFRAGLAHRREILERLVERLGSSI